MPVRVAVLVLAGSLSFGGPRREAPPAPMLRDIPRDERGTDRWFARDKASHFVVSLMIQGAAHAALRANGREYREASLLAGAATLGVGVGKEVWDRRRGGRSSWKDLGADLAGGATGAAVMRQVDRTREE